MPTPAATLRTEEPLKAGEPREPRAPKFLTVAEVADLLRVSKMTVYRLIESGELQASRLGRLFRILEADVRLYVAACALTWEDCGPAVKVLVELDGVTVPLADCEWVWFLACGCPFACAHADSADEQAMWISMFDRRDEVQRQRRRGVSAELVTKTRFRDDIAPKLRLSYSCPHQAEDPTP